MIIFRFLWFFKAFSPFTISLHWDGTADVKAYVRKLPRLTLVILSDNHYIASYRLSTLVEYQNAFLKTDKDLSNCQRFLLPKDIDLPKARVKKLKRRSIMPDSKVIKIKPIKAHENNPSLGVDFVSSFTVGEEIDISTIIRQEQESADVSKDVFCQECDIPVNAIVHCLQCNSDLCYSHKEVHKYMKTYAKHEFIPIVVFLILIYFYILRLNSKFVKIVLFHRNSNNY